MKSSPILDSSQQRKFGVIINYANLLLRAVSSFWVTQVIVERLGMAEYGLIALSGSVLVMLPLLAFGLNYTIPRYVAEYRARNDMKGLRNFLGICQKFLYLISIVSAVICAFLYYQLDVIFPNLTVGEMEKVKIMFIMLSAGSIIYFSQCIYTYIIESFQCFILYQVLNSSTMILTMIGSVLFVVNGQGAIGVTAVSLIVQIINIFPARLYCWKKLRAVPNIRYWNWALTRKSLNYSLWAFFGILPGFFGESLAPLIIGSSCTPTDVSIFKIGTLITAYFYVGSNAAGAFFPKIVEMVTNNASRKDLTDIMIKVARIDVAMAFLFVGGFVLIGRQFLELWLSGKDLQPYMVTVWYVGLLSCSTVPFFASFLVGWQIMRARDLLKFRVVVELIPNIVGTVVGYMFALKYGLFGFMWCRLVFFGIVLVVITLVYFSKIGRLDIPRFMKDAYLSPMIPLVFSLGLGSVYLYFLPVVSWMDFLVAGVVYTALYITSSWLFFLNGDEKRMAKGIVARVFGAFRKMLPGS